MWDVESTGTALLIGALVMFFVLACSLLLPRGSSSKAKTRPAKTLAEGLAECRAGQHDQVWATYYLKGNPRLYPWICRRCGKRGRSVNGHVDCEGWFPTYNRLVEKWGGPPDPYYIWDDDPVK